MGKKLKADPWDNDPVVEQSTAKDPWDNDPVVNAAPAQDDTEVAGPPSSAAPKYGEIHREPLKKKEPSSSQPAPGPTEGPLARPRTDQPSGKDWFVDSALLKKVSVEQPTTSKQQAEQEAKKYLGELGDKLRAETEKERNPAVSAAKSIWNTVGYQMPAAIAAAGSIASAGLYQAAIAEQGGASLEGPDKITTDVTQQVKKDMLNWAMEHKKKGAVITQDVITSMDQAHDAVDWINWTANALGNAAGQIPAAVLSGGTTAMGQEIGSIYMDGLEKIAQEEGMSVDQVIDQGLDEPAFAIAYGTAAGLLERVGAGKVLSTFGKEAVKRSFRQRALSVVAAGATESSTEYAQTYLEQLGASQVGGKDIQEAFKEARTSEAARERLESAAQGFVGGGGLSVGSLFSPRETTQIATAEVDPTNHPALETKAEVIQAKVDQQEDQLAAGQPDAKPALEVNVTIAPPVNETTQEAEPAAPVIQEEQPVVPETQAEEEAPQAAEEEVSVWAKVAVRKEVDKLIYSGDLSRDENGKVQVLTEKGGKELYRILDENKIPHKRSGAVQYEDRPIKPPEEFVEPTPTLEQDAVQEQSAASVPVRERAGGSQEVPVGDTQGGEVTTEGQGQEEVQVEDQQGDAGNVQQLNEQPIDDSANQRGVSAETTGSSQGDGLPPSGPPKTPERSGKEPVRESRFRKTWLRVKDDPDISDEIKNAISQEAKEYIPRSLSLTQKEADVVIDANGTDNSVKIYLDENNGMRADVETALGARLFTRLQDEGNYDDAVRVFEKLAIKGTSLGQAINAYKLIKGKTMLHVLERALRKSRGEYKASIKKTGAKAKSTIDDINKQAVDQVLASAPVQKAKKSKAASVKKAIDFLETLKIDTKGKALDISFGITAAAWNTVITTVQKSLQAGLTITQAIDKAMKGVTDPNFKRTEAREYLDEQLASYRVTLDPEKAIRTELKAQGTSIDDIIRSHYTEQASTKKDLVAKLIKDGNVDPQQAQEIADALSAKFDELTRAAKERALNKIVPKGDKKVTPKERKDMIDRLIEQSNMGALAEEQYLDAITEQIGVPKLTGEQAKHIQELTEKIQTAKGDTQRSKAGQDLYNYIENLKGWKWYNAVEAVWFANMLSGPSTQFTNIYANLYNLLTEASQDIARNPKHAGFILSRIASGLTRGLIQAGDVLSTGYDPSKSQSQKAEAKPLLERIEFKGGKINPGNWLKYVGRAIKAGDVIFYQALKQQSLAVQAIKEARKNGRGKANAQDVKTIYNQLMAGKYDAAITEAQNEGFTGRDAKIRAYEIMEQNIPEMAIQEAENFASTGTFNRRPEGVLGAVADILNNMRRVFPPLKVVVPFVNTILNVANEFLNYNPVIGIWRALPGGSMGFKWLGKDNYRELSAEERGRILTKAIIGATSMVAMALLDTGEEDSPIEITANGTGDTKKNYQLEREGWRPYSVRIGDTWFSYKNTPLALPMAMVGFWKDTERYGFEPSIIKKTEVMTMGSFRMFMDMSTLSGLADFLELTQKDTVKQMENGAKGLFKYLERTAKSVLIPNYFTQMAKLIQEFTDTPNKKAQEIGESLIRDLPVIRDRLGNMYDAFGDPVVPRQMEKFLPLNMSRTPKDVEMFKFLSEHKLFVGVVSPANLKPDGEPMTKEEFEEYAIAAARNVKEKLMREYPRYARKEANEKNEAKIQDWFDELVRETRSETKLQLFD